MSETTPPINITPGEPTEKDWRIAAIDQLATSLGFNETPAMKQIVSGVSEAAEMDFETFVQNYKDYQMLGEREVSSRKDVASQIGFNISSAKVKLIGGYRQAYTEDIYEAADYANQVSSELPTGTVAKINSLL